MSFHWPSPLFLHQRDAGFFFYVYIYHPPFINGIDAEAKSISRLTIFHLEYNYLVLKYFIEMQDGEIDTDNKENVANCVIDLIFFKLWFCKDIVNYGDNPCFVILFLNILFF